MLYLLDEHDSSAPFPPAERAEREPNGLLAVGGDLSPTRLLNAYRAGIFPWYSEGEPILWWSPDPRMVLRPDQLHISRSLRKSLRKRGYRVSFDQAFSHVVGECAGPRRDAPGTWITAEMAQAYAQLHELGHAHSVEVWQQQRLVGGLYGVAVGRAFFGESMFSHRSDASKTALVALCKRLHQWGYELIDCQVHTGHLQRMGATEITRNAFQRQLDRLCTQSPRNAQWQQPAIDATAFLEAA